MNANVTQEENLYVGSIKNKPGNIKIDDRDHPAVFWGSILIYGIRNNGEFVIQGLRRIVLYGRLDDPEPKDRVGIFSLASSLPEPAEQNLNDNYIKDIQMQLHYQALTTELPPLIDSDDAVFPQIEQILASFSWVKVEPIDRTNVQMTIEFITNKFIKSELEVIQSAHLPPVEIPFQLIGTGGPRPDPTTSLRSNCDPPPPPLACPGIETRTLAIKFVNFSHSYDTENMADKAALETLCNTQLDKVCEVWRNKATLDPIVHSVIEQPLPEPNGSTPIKDTYFNCSKSEEGSIPSTGFASATHLDIYLVDTLVDRSGGGITHDDNEASAYCILEVGRMATNPYLLAHELCHVVGLAHPDGTAGILPSSWNSIAEPGDPNPVAHTLYNMRIFTDPGFPLNPLVLDSYPSSPDCFRPDPVDHFIRDFPTDDGSEPSPAGIPSWNKSNLWNRRTPTAGTPHADNSPEHEEPLCGADNYMYTKLEYTGPRNRDTNIDLYLGAPGMADDLVPLVEPIPNNRITFPPNPPYPKSDYLTWTVPAGFPSHCCAFAVAHDAVEEPWPFATPATALTLADLVNRRNLDNDIVQRNLNFQDCTPTGDAGWSTLLYWIQLINPFDEEMSANVEINTTAARDLEALELEVNGKFWDKPILPGSFELVEFGKLSPEETIVLRMRATLPPGQQEGKLFPISMKFLLEDRTITGYDHVIHIAPLERTALQVLDNVFAGLRDIAVGFEIDTAYKLAEEVRLIVLEQKISSDCWKSINAVYGIEPRDWWELIREKATSFAFLAVEFEAIANNAPEYKIVREWLNRLAQLVVAPPDSPHLFLESVRESSDRIQESTRHVIRRKQQP